MIELLQQRLDSYHLDSSAEEEQATREILQEVALYLLWRAGLFKVAAFQGGTSLRILHRLPRFSEDLDFILKGPDPAFEWTPYRDKLTDGLAEFGLHSEVLDKSRMEQNIRKAPLKDNSIGNQLNLSFYQGGSDRRLTIKLEIDVNPPSGSGFDYSYLDFPLDYEICHQDLSSNFSLKIHALLCRSYLKGRDWYDFNWYIKQGVTPNLPLLQNALTQYGPWENRTLSVDINWLKAALLEKIEAIDWSDARRDVERFLKPVEKQSLELWSNRFFQSRVEKML